MFSVVFILYTRDIFGSDILRLNIKRYRKYSVKLFYEDDSYSGGRIRSAEFSESGES